MTAVELKLYLNDNPSLIVDLLESVGCNSIVLKDDKITCTNPDGDNIGAVNVFLNNTLNCHNHTRPDYQIEYDIRDIITLIQFFLNISFQESVEYIKNTCGISSKDNLRVESTISRLKKLKRDINKEFKCNDVALNEDEINQYFDLYIKQFEEDGITKEIQDEFQIRYDLYDNRAIIPIRNEDGLLITFKGRTLSKGCLKELGIPKYIYTHKFTGKYYLYGEYENMKHIEIADFVYIFEAEKSVLQAASFGIRNCMAISKKEISRQQIQKLLKLGKPIVMAFDKDVKLNDVLNQCRKIKGIPVYYIYDTDGYLDGKMSPTDDGVFTFEMLDAMCKFKYEGE